MGLFNKSEMTKEEKYQAKLEKYMKKYRLTDLDDAELEMIKEINSQLMGTGGLNAGITFSLSAKAEEKLMVHYTAAMLKQNWMIIRQLNKLNKNLEKLTENK